MVPPRTCGWRRCRSRPNGKLDRAALPAPEGDAYASRAYEAPVGEAEEALAEIWAEVLGVERVGRHDHFFELGGHSLLAMQVISRVRQALGVEVALGDAVPPPRAGRLRARAEAAARAELPPSSRCRASAWHSPSRSSGSGSSSSWEAGGGRTTSRRGCACGASWTARRTGRALDRIVARHEALRTTFHAVDGEPEQRAAAEESGFHLATTTCAGTPRPRRSSSAWRRRRRARRSTWSGGR
jgi:acyl carrier protein